LGRYYANEQFDIPADSVGFQTRADSQLWKVEILRKQVPPPASLLEVGPATGEFAYCARQKGYRPTLFEMDERCCGFLREVLALDVVQTSNPAESLDAATAYDAICIWQAIEHIPNFWTLMERSIDRLGPGGVLILSTPNPCSLQARILRRFWPHLDAPRHLYLIPQSWVRSFARKHGLAAVFDTTRDVGSIGLNYYGWLLAARNAVRGKVSNRIIEAAAGRITALVRRWESREGRGCSYTIALRKG